MKHRLVSAALLLTTVVQAASGRDDEHAAQLVLPASIRATVIHVNDGDTLVLRDVGGRNFTVRLTDIDAPETSHGAGRPGQPFSAKATTHLKGLALGMAAHADCHDVDRRQDGDRVRLRYICRVQVDGKDVSLAMIEAGMAMANRQNRRYVRDKAAYALEDQARGRKAGLWSLPEPIAPWKWRQMCWTHKFCEAADQGQ